MSIFSAILDKLGLHKETPAAPVAPAPAAPVAPTHAAPAHAAPVAPAHTAPAHAAPVAPAHTAPVHATPVAPAHTAPVHATPVVPARPAPDASAYVPAVPAYVPSAHPSAALVEVKPEAVSVVDVYAKLETLAAKLGTPSNWKTSIADLLFLLGMDHSFKARKELAVELGCPQNLMDDSAKMNTWLHKTVLTKIAENGGNIPKELLD